MTAVGGQLMMQLHEVQHDSIKWLDRKHLKGADDADVRETSCATTP